MGIIGLAGLGAFGPGVRIRQGRIITAALRISAAEMEAVVVPALPGWLRDEAEVLEVLKQAEQLAAASTIRKVLLQPKGWAAQLEAGDGAETLELMQKLVNAVVIEEAQVDVQIRGQALLDKPDNSSPAVEGNEYVVHRVVKAQLKRCGMAMRLAVDGGVAMGRWSVGSPYRLIPIWCS